MSHLLHPAVLEDLGLTAAVESYLKEFGRCHSLRVDLLGDRMEELENAVGNPHVVGRGETHSEIVMNYLTTTAGLARDEADRVMKRTALIWELEPGNRVYNLYWKGVFLTTVTQGDAKRSPLVVQQHVRKATTDRIMALESMLGLTAPDTTMMEMPKKR